MNCHVKRENNLAAAPISTQRSTIQLCTQRLCYFFGSSLHYVCPIPKLTTEKRGASLPLLTLDTNN